MWKNKRKRCENNKLKVIIKFPPIHVYINKINNRLVFEIKDGCKRELEIPEKMKLLAQKNWAQKK